MSEPSTSPQEESQLTLDPDEFESFFLLSTGWSGYHSIKHLVIFGDSYSSVQWDYRDPKTRPSVAEPLGIRYPGATYTTPHTIAVRPNWVGYLTKLYPELGVIVYDYAIGGSTVNMVNAQINNMFLGPKGAGTKPDWAQWQSETTLFVGWVGVNDVCYPHTLDAIDSQVSRFVQLFIDLYQTINARNFLFINVPPRNFPEALNSSGVKSYKAHTSKIQAWNRSLSTHLHLFQQTHTDANILLFSAWSIFSNVLNDPTSYGFETEDTKSFSRMWVDGVHPTTDMHSILAETLGVWLTSLSPTQGT